MNLPSHTKTDQPLPFSQRHLARKDELPKDVSIRRLLQLHRAYGNKAFGRFIQAKLKINQPGDAYEQEADHVADQVMQMRPPKDVGSPIRHDADARTLRRTPESPYSLSEGMIVPSRSNRWSPGYGRAIAGAAGR